MLGMLLLSVVHARRAAAQHAPVAALLAAINVERRAAGLGDLLPDPDLRIAAMSWSSSLAAHGREVQLRAAAGLHSHELHGSTPARRLASVGVTGRAWGEIYFLGLSEPQALVDGWMASPPHHAAILTPAFRVAGIGWVERADDPAGFRWYVVVLFSGAPPRG